MIVDTFKQVFRNGETFIIYVGTGTMLSRQCVTTGYRNKSCYIIRRDISRLVHFATAVPGQLRAFLPPQDRLQFWLIDEHIVHCVDCIVRLYTVSHKKRATLFLIITLAFLGRFLYFLHQWKEEEILYTGVSKIYHFIIIIIIWKFIVRLLHSRP